MRGVSLDEIAKSTKIGTRLLRALEEEQFDLLPGGIFNKGFVRSYARYLGMDEDQAVADYLQASGNEETEAQLNAQTSDWVESKYRESGRKSSRGFPFMPVLVLVVAVAAGFGGWKMYQERVQERQAGQAEREALQGSQAATAAPPVASDTKQTGTAEPSSGSVGTQQAASTVQPSSAPPASSDGATVSGFEVEVKTTGRAWVSLKADGKILVRGVLDADQSRTLHADNEIVVWTGNVGATRVSFQGKPVPMEGGANETRVLVFKLNGLQPTASPASESPAYPPSLEPSPTPQ